MINLLRNLRMTLRGQRLSSVLNVAGLAIAIAVAYMIAVQVQYELSYNKDIKDANRIAVVFNKDKGSNWSFARDEWFNMLERKYIEIQESNPAIEQLAAYMVWQNTMCAILTLYRRLTNRDLMSMPTTIAGMVLT